MYICMTCQDNSEKTITEICEFRGIRFDNRYKTAVISTEHEHHDYVVPMTETKYEQLVDEIAVCMKEHSLIYLKNGVVYRCKKGEIRNGDVQNITVSF